MRRGALLAAFAALLAGCQAASAEPTPQLVDQAIYRPASLPAVNPAFYVKPANEKKENPIKLVSDTQPVRYPLARAIGAAVLLRVPNPCPRMAAPAPVCVPVVAPTIAPPEPITEDTIEKAVAGGIEKAVADLAKKADEKAAAVEKKPEPPEEKTDKLLHGVLSLIASGAAVFAIRMFAS